MKNRYIIIFCSFLVGFQVLFAKNYTISGTVQDKSSEEKLPFASIYVKDIQKGVSSNKNGAYSLILPNPGEYTVVINYMGYEPFESALIIKNDSTVNFKLQSKSVQLEECVVTGTRTPKLLKDAPVITKVVTAEEIKKIDVATVKDILETELPGIEFTDHGGNTNINMQGMGGAYILFLVDGERIAGETRDNVDYSRLNLENIERVEIVKGAASALYGSNAIGGVVNIITKNASEPWQVNLNTRIGQPGDFRYGLTAGFKTKKWNSLTTATYKSFAGYTLTDTKFAEQIYGNEVVKDTILRSTVVDSSKDFSINEKLTYHVNDKLTLTAKGSYFQRERMNTGKKVHDKYRGINGGLNAFYNISEKQNLELAYNYDLYNKYYFYVMRDSNAVNYANEQHTIRGQYNYSFRRDNVLTIGGEFFEESLETYQFADNGTHGYVNGVLYAQHDMNITPVFNVVYGARLDYHSVYGFHPTPKASLMYKLKNFTFRGSYARGFKSPSLKELYTDWDHQGMFQLIGNANLIPEKSNNFSLSTEFTKGKVNMSVIGFYNNIKDKIETVWNTGEDTTFYKNLKSVEMYGADFNVTVELPYGFKVKGAYSYVHHYYGEDGVNTSTTRPHSATGRLEYTFSRKNYRLNAVLNGKLLGKVAYKTYNDDRDEYYTTESPAYTMWKLVVNQRFYDAATLSLGVDNLFDYHPKVYNFNSSLSYGRTFFVSLSVDVESLFKIKK